MGNGFWVLGNKNHECENMITLYFMVNCIEAAQLL